MSKINKRKILFLTGTRADYGKLKPLIKKLDADPIFEVSVFVCGMHLSQTFGSTYHEVMNDSYKNVYVAFGLNQTQNQSVNLGNTVCCLAGYVENTKPDMIVVHGDRIDALAGAVVGALNNIIVAHIEGGELSGTVDESIRHAISKFAHAHFVCNDEAKKRLIQLGEKDTQIFVIGSPDIDIMMSDQLPTQHDVKIRYGIKFTNYGIMMYHPVTTEYDCVRTNIKAVVDAIIASNINYVVIFPNNDLGSEIIINEYQRFVNNPRIVIYPSLRFEYFLTLLKNSNFIIGNSSAGVREAGIYGIPAIDIGTRQTGRYQCGIITNIQHVIEDTNTILSAIIRVKDYHYTSFLYGKGNSTEKFYDILSSSSFWHTKIQKHFVDCDM